MQVRVMTSVVLQTAAGKAHGAVYAWVYAAQWLEPATSRSTLSRQSCDRAPLWTGKWQPGLWAGPPDREMPISRETGEPPRSVSFVDLLPLGISSLWSA